jgi:hypothetical protein
MRWAEHLAQMRKKRNAYRLLVGKPVEKKPLERQRLRLVYIIKMDLEVKEWCGVDWRRAPGITVMIFGVPKNAEKFLSGCTNDSFSRRA